MAERRGMQTVMEQAKAAGTNLTDTHDLVYQATLATLLRVKRKERVPPRDHASTKAFDFDTLVEARFPPYGSKLDPDKPPAHPYDCDPECETCFTQTFPARVNVTDKMALTHVRTLTRAVNDDLQALRSYLLSHADHIVAKWKKSKAKRTELLVDLCSEVKTSSLTEHNPDSVSLHGTQYGIIHLIHGHNQDGMRELLKADKLRDDTWELRFTQHLMNFAERKDLEDQKDRYQTTWLLPYLDVESLVKDPLLFLGLLHARTAHSPVYPATCTWTRSKLISSQEEWMMFDNSQLKAAEGFEVLVPEFNRHYVTMTGAEYGLKLVKWDEERCHHWQIVGYQKAIHILSAQRHMMRFLRGVVEKLLEEKLQQPHQRPASHPKWDALMHNGFFSFGSASGVSIRASANQPFTVPPAFDPMKTFELVESMYEASVDEFDMAQTNPAFLQCLIRGLESSVYSKAWETDGRWAFIMDELICNFYRRFVWWRQMRKECVIMLEKYRRYLAKPDKESRKAYELALFTIHDVATEHLVQQIMLVQYSMPFQPGFVCNFEYERTSDRNQPMTIEDKDAFHSDKLFWSIRGLGFDRDRLFTMDPSFQFRVLDHHLSNASVKERKRINDQLLRSLSEMAVVDEIRTSIACDRGWSREPTPPDDYTLPDFRNDFIEKYQKKLSLPELIKNTGLPQLLRTFHKNSPWPSGKINEARVRAMTASRDNLNKMWSRFRAGLKSQQIRKGFSTTFMDEDETALSAALKPSHIRFVEEEKQTLRNAMKARSPPSLPARPSSFPIEEPEKFIAPTAKAKKKTRPSASTDTGSSQGSPTVMTPALTTTTAETEPQPVEMPNVVKPENFRLFQAMFSTPKASMRSYSWIHFTQAMVDAGCSVTQGSGSAVHFRSSHGVIVFHRPHPEPTIAQEIFIAMGKRLAKRFGWTESAFRCDGVSD